jgi:V/A-type H+-transporting ATPase subunit K
MLGKRRLFRLALTTVILAAAAGAAIGPPAALAQVGTGKAAGQDAPGSVQVRWDLAIAVGMSIGLPCLAAGYAIGKVGAAALGAASERPELLTRSLIFVALGEGIAVFGLLVAVLVLVIGF